MPTKEFTVSLSPIHSSHTAGQVHYRIAKIVGQGVTFTAPTGTEYQVGDVIAKEQANALGPAIRISVTR